MSGLDSLIRGLERLQRRLETKQHEILEQLKDFGVEYAKSQVLNVDTGETMESINGRVEGNKLIIEAGGNAVWLEFGTGITKASYPGELPDGIVPHGAYGQGKGSNPNGWYFATTDPSLAVFDSDGHYWMNADGTYIAHTMGIEPNMFMLKTILAIEQKAEWLGLKMLDAELKAL